MKNEHQENIQAQMLQEWTTIQTILQQHPQVLGFLPAKILAELQRLQTRFKLPDFMPQGEVHIGEDEFVKLATLEIAQLISSLGNIKNDKIISSKAKILEYINQRLDFKINQTPIGNEIWKTMYEAINSIKENELSLKTAHNTLLTSLKKFDKAYLIAHYRANKDQYQRKRKFLFFGTKSSGLDAENIRTDIPSTEADVRFLENAKKDSLPAELAQELNSFLKELKNVYKQKNCILDSVLTAKWRQELSKSKFFNAFLVELELMTALDLLTTRMVYGAFQNVIEVSYTLDQITKLLDEEVDRSTPLIILRTRGQLLLGMLDSYCLERSPFNEEEEKN